MACASSLASSLAAVRSLARAGRPELAAARPRRRAPILARARALRRRASIPPRPPRRRRGAPPLPRRARLARASPRAAATDAPGGDASDAETERPARASAASPRRGGKPDTGDRAEARATAAATDPPRDDETDDESDAPQVFDMRELYGDDYDFDDEDEDDEEAMDEDALDAALASMSSSLLRLRRLRRARPAPSAQLLSGTPRGTSPDASSSSAAQMRKSTLLNQLVGTKLSIVTYKPQTTRHRILGIVSEPTPDGLPGYPGRHAREFNKLDFEIMLRSVRGAMANADVTLVIVDASRDAHGDFEGLLPPLKNPGEGDRAPIAVILNKCDLLELEDIRVLKREFETAYADRVRGGVPGVAARGVGHDKGEGVVRGEDAAGAHALYPKDAISDTLTFLRRGRLSARRFFLQHAQETPYSTQVWVQSHKERDGEEGPDHREDLRGEEIAGGGILIGAGGRAQETRGGGEEDIGVPGKAVFLDLGVSQGRVALGRERARGLGADDSNRLEQPSLGPKPDRVA